MRKLTRVLPTSIIIVAIICFFLQSCSKSENNVDTDPPNSNDPLITTNIRGFIVDENGASVQGATVKAGNRSTTTDALGTFYFKDVSVNESNGYIRVEKSGYIISGRSFLPSAGRTHEVRLVLASTTAQRTYIYANPTSVTTPNLEKLTWASSAFQLLNGTAYTGTVTPVFVCIPAIANNRIPMMAGDFRAIDMNGTEKVIFPSTYASVFLSGNGGEALKFAPGSVASVEATIPYFVAPTAPTTIPLWFFNDTTGRWTQQGTATKVSDKYVFNIDRLGHWLCAIPYEAIRLNGTIKSQLSSDPINCEVLKISNNTLHYIGTITDSSGYFDLMVPANTALKLAISDRCTYNMVSLDRGPFSSNTSVGTLSTNALPNQIYNYKGTVKNCSGGLVNNGAVFFFSGFYRYHTSPIVNGQFSFSSLACESGAIRFYAIDYATGLKSPVKAFSPPGLVGGIFSLGELNTCATYNGEFLKISIEGNNYNLVSPTDSFGVSTFNSTYPGYSRQTLVTIKSYSAGNSWGNYQINQFSFYHNNTSGILPVGNLGSGPVTIYVTPPLFFSQAFSRAYSPEVTITALGPVGTGFIEGYFSWQIAFGATEKTVTGSFKIRNN